MSLLHFPSINLVSIAKHKFDEKTCTFLYKSIDPLHMPNTQIFLTCTTNTELKCLIVVFATPQLRITLWDFNPDQK